MDKRLQAILYILNCDEALRAKVLPYIQHNPNVIHWAFIKELSLSKREQRFIAWMELLSMNERLELPDALGAGGVLELGHDMPSQERRICLKAFAIRSGWGV